MTIRVTCPCGRQLEGADADAFKLMKCPDCGRELILVDESADATDIVFPSAAPGGAAKDAEKNDAVPGTDSVLPHVELGGTTPRFSPAAPVGEPPRKSAPAQAAWRRRLRYVLAAFPKPTGPDDPLPIDAGGLEELRAAAEVRNRVRVSARAYLIVLVLCVVPLLVLGTHWLMFRFVPPKGALPPKQVMNLDMTLALVASEYAAVALLHIAAAMATIRNARWVPIVMGILYIVLLLANWLATGFVVMKGRAPLEPLAVGLGVGTVVPVVLARISFRAAAAAQAFAGQPRWCRRLLMSVDGLRAE